MYTFDKASTRLPSFDEVEFINADNDNDVDDEAIADEVALLLLDDSCSSLNWSASTPNYIGSIDSKPPHI